ncbi:GTPase [Ferrovum myxofaciens]|uniref:GTPase n=1 Tax=Ferrovum myxofaciens TaxID=416213 RepID=UPI000550522E|nr:GTPase [Ferrovum myxofaciens]
MNNTTSFEILDWATAGNDLLKRASTELGNVPSEKIRDLAKQIPAAVLAEDETIKLVFAGQYSAGKSTILKALTGRADIATGAGITTQEAHVYEWDGVCVIDTPGVHTELRPDHDEISYQAISSADLLVFVVTNELFDSHLAKHFRKLAIEKDKAHEMMLVVNKMRRCATGNSVGMQDIIREDLRKVLAPFSPEDMRICFIDAESFIDSQHENDSETAAMLRKKSGIEVFTKELNTFVRESGMAGRYTTALYSLEQVLQEALSVESNGDNDVDALEELLLQRRRALHETRDRIPRTVEKEIQNVGTQIRQDGRKVADLINGNADQKEVNNELQKAQDRVQLHADNCGKSIERAIEQQVGELEETVRNILNSELAKELVPRLNHRIQEANISPEAMGRINKAADISQKLGKFLIENSFKAGGSGALGGMFKLSQYSGTNAHVAVKAVGQFFGKTFKPWEAVKWAKLTANAGRVLAVVGTVLTIYLQFKEEADAAQLEVDLRESRASIRGGFNDAAHAIEMHFDKATGTYIADTFDPEIESVDKQLAELREMQQTRSDLFRNMGELLEETRQLIKVLHANTAKP